MNKRKLVPAFYYQFIFNFLDMEFSPTTEKLLSWNVNLSTADSNHIAEERIKLFLIHMSVLQYAVTGHSGM